MAFKRLMVTGADGMLGRDLVPFLSAKGYEVTPANRSRLDLLGTLDDIKKTVEEIEPEIIIHPAGMTNVDTAEQDPDLAMAINKDGTRKLVLAAKEVGAIIAYISTDYVFDGKQDTPYTVHDRPNPINAYGLSKYYGELMVTELMDTFYIIRTSWLYGINKRNFVQFVLESARQGRSVNAACDMIGAPTWTGSLSAMIENIVTSGRYGIYHGVDQGEISRHQQALAICSAAGLSTGHIHQVKTHELNLKAPRPLYSVMDPGELSVPSWETSFQAYLEQYKRLSHAGGNQGQAGQGV